MCSTPLNGSLIRSLIGSFAVAVKLDAFGSGERTGVSLKASIGASVGASVSASAAASVAESLGKSASLACDEASSLGGWPWTLAGSHGSSNSNAKNWKTTGRQTSKRQPLERQTLKQQVLNRQRVGTEGAAGRGIRPIRPGRRLGERNANSGEVGGGITLRI
jgi:hypothetical protein